MLGSHIGKINLNQKIENPVKLMKCNGFISSDHLWTAGGARGRRYVFTAGCQKVINLKALFNKNFHFNKSELHGPKCYQCLW